MRGLFSLFLAETGASGAPPRRGGRWAIRIASPPLGGYVFEPTFSVQNNEKSLPQGRLFSLFLAETVGFEPTIQV